MTPNGMLLFFMQINVHELLFNLLRLTRQRKLYTLQPRKNRFEPQLLASKHLTHSLKEIGNMRMNVDELILCHLLAR